MIVGQAHSERLPGETLTVMHITFRRIIAKDPIGHNLLFVDSEPAFASDFRCGLIWRRRQVEVRDDSDDAGQRSFQSKKPLPSIETLMARSVPGESDIANGLVSKRSTETKDAIGQECRHNAGALVCDPKIRESPRQLGGCIEVAEVENDIWDKTALDHAEQPATDEEACSVGHERLATGNERPREHLYRDPIVRAEFLRYQLRRKFREQESAVEDHLSIVVVIAGHVQIDQHAIRECLDDIAAIELQGEEHQATPTADPPVEPAYKTFLIVFVP